MGTNYYWNSEPCDHCGRSDEQVHICKSLNSFRGHFLWNDEADAYTPWLVSWEQWKDYLRNHTGRIVDEYGGRHDVEDFIGRVETVPMEARRRQFDWVLTHRRVQRSPSGRPSPSGDWLDADGFSFYGGEFS